MDFSNECLHGTRVVSGNLPTEVVERGATVFPQPLGMAATFDAELIRRVGDASATASSPPCHTMGGAPQSPSPCARAAFPPGLFVA